MNNSPHEMKAVYGPDKIIDITIQGEECSYSCDYCVELGFARRCVVFGDKFGIIPHPNCLAPGINTGPIPHNELELYKTYWILTKRLNCLLVAAQIVDTCERNQFPKFITDDNFASQDMKPDYEAYLTESAAKERAAALLREALEKLGEKS